MEKEHQIRDVYKVGESVPLVLPTVKYNWKITELFRNRFFKLAVSYTSLFTGNPGLARVRAEVMLVEVLKSFNLKSHTPISLMIVKDFRPSLYRLTKELENLVNTTKEMRKFAAPTEVIELNELKEILILKKFKSLVNDLSLVEPILKNARIGITL